MRSVYRKIDDVSLAVLDVSRYSSKNEWMITRINVPRQHRGQGVGSALLRAVLDMADEEGATLWLEILSQPDSLSRDELAAWYERAGFKPLPGYVWRRRPKK